MTLVTHQPKSNSSGFDLQSKAIHGADAECASPTCTDTHSEHTLTLGATLGGMVADWGVVTFCSYNCFLDFTNLNAPLRETEHPADRPGATIHWEGTYTVTASDGDDITRELACSDHLIAETVQSLTATKLTSCDSFTVRVVENGIGIASRTVSDTGEIESVVNELMTEVVQDMTNTTLAVNELLFNVTEHS